MKICPIAYKINQSNLIILPNMKWTLSKCAKVFFITSCQRGEISPNLATLFSSSSTRLCRMKNKAPFVKSFKFVLLKEFRWTRAFDVWGSDRRIWFGLANLVTWAYVEPQCKVYLLGQLFYLCFILLFQSHYHIRY